MLFNGACVESLITGCGTFSSTKYFIHAIAQNHHQATKNQIPTTTTLMVGTIYRAITSKVSGKEYRAGLDNTFYRFRLPNKPSMRILEHVKNGPP